MTSETDDNAACFLTHAVPFVSLLKGKNKKIGGIEPMKKVVYSISRLNKFGNTKMTGVGFITESDLVIACVSQKGNPYIRVFEDCVKNCHAIPNRDGEFKGAHYEIREVEYETRNGSGEFTGYDKREVEIEYSVWYKLVD